MNFIKFFTLNVLLLFFIGCGEEKDPDRQFSLQLKKKGKSYKASDTIYPSLKNKKDLPVDEVKYVLAGKELESAGEGWILNSGKLGLQQLTARIISGEKVLEVSEDIKILAPQSPQLYTYSIVNEFPHDITSFTQGLEFYKDTLYESTGSGGGAKSYVRKINFETGKVFQQVDLEPQYFGEGITLINDKLYQLTWQQRVGFIYKASSLDRMDQFQYGKSKEGWGLCNDGKYLYKSDGTEKIWLLNPETMKEEDHIQIVTDKSIFNKANELEYVKGKIYANVWQKESMMIIDAKSGAIEGVVNLGGLKEKVAQHPKLDVLNGIAFHPERNTFFVTGKNWDKLFEITLQKKE
ncbi:glutaminyl-peptide cyclotransferase [Muriicola soli]|uniref:Glutaminyl-peptide cyclotransferase n=1 Tax=Muriicola soli TaxID=2507538 RepID=A0A411E9X2_9FLAO|nr:glutaminyl-peptide cyclotransferase [Muriicola soli]QBA64343.1 glutaminyl-peptide cyclotransferase [Muriicola soli]